VGQLSSSSASMAVGSGAPPAKLRAPAWASAFGETPRTVDLAPESGWRREDGKGRRLGFEYGVNKILPDSAPIYRGFSPSARDRCGLKSHAFFR
jgi:hypothetical protein